MGILYSKPIESLTVNKYETFVPTLSWNRNLVSPPEVFYFHEFILQSLVKQWLSQNTNLQILFNSFGLNGLQAKDFELLGEKALPEGHVDILIKDYYPKGRSTEIVVEVKTGEAKLEHVIQARNYMHELGEECVAGVLIARGFSKRVAQKAEIEGIKYCNYSFDGVTKDGVSSFEELMERFRLDLV